MVNSGENTKKETGRKDGNELPSVCMITSSKGGVGKSTVCANLGMALAMRGKRTLLVDCDFCNRSLDLLTGLENAVLYRVPDVLSGTVPIKKAVLTHPGNENLMLLAASGTDASQIPDTAALAALIEAAETLSPDFVLLDLPGSSPELMKAAAAVSGEALVISSPQAISVRSAEAAAQLLTACGINSVSLVVNTFPVGKSRAEKDRDFMTLLTLVDDASLMLRAVIPFDSGIWERQDQGLLIDDPSYRKTGFRQAVMNLAARQCGYQVPLFSKSVK